MAAEFIYTLRQLGRFYPPDREVLRDVTLAFLPGAKIGVIGHNGSGKSTLLRIMAGLDDGYSGDARLLPGATVGLLPQEPGAGPGTRCRGQRDGRRGSDRRVVERVRGGDGGLGRAGRRFRRAGHSPSRTGRSASQLRTRGISTVMSPSRWTH